MAQYMCSSYQYFPLFLELTLCLEIEAEAGPVPIQKLLLWKQCVVWEKECELRPRPT